MQLSEACLRSTLQNQGELLLPPLTPESYALATTQASERDVHTQPSPHRAHLLFGASGGEHDPRKLGHTPAH